MRALNAIADALIACTEVLLGVCVVLGWWLGFYLLRRMQ